jgi:hypothetical protein
MGQGDIYDPDDFDRDRDHSSFGDVIVVEYWSDLRPVYWAIFGNGRLVAGLLAAAGAVVVAF